MGLTNKPADDSKAMTDEYVKGARITDLAAKYNHTEQEVEAIVTNPAPVEQLPTQREETAAGAEAPAKKEK